MWWFLLSFVLVSGFLVVLYRLSRSDGGAPDDLPPLVPSGRDVHGARAWDNLVHGRGNGPSVGGGMG